MFSYLKSFFTGSKPASAHAEFETRLYQLIYPSNNYEKKCIINSAIACIENGVLLIKNDDYMGDAEEIE